MLLVAASTLMLFVALAQALDERRYDLAIMRALGASRVQVAAVLLAESLVLAAADRCWVVLAHAAAAAIPMVDPAGGAAGGRGARVPAGGVGGGRGWRWPRV